MKQLVRLVIKGIDNTPVQYFPIVQNRISEVGIDNRPKRYIMLYYRMLSNN